jgi:hypothetical protein
MQELLAVFEDPRRPASTNYFRKLEGQNRTSLGGLVNTEGIVEGFLDIAEVGYTPCKRYWDAKMLILKALPKYADPPWSLLADIVEPVLFDAILSDAKKVRHIKEQILLRYRYLEKPPSWIQGPNWPLRDGRPLIFVGEVPIDAPDLFHDLGAAYVFFDPGHGAFEVVTQFH